ncbi:DUF1835 domain-containing protein [Halalkalibacter alkalisediminis]|uniref:DUF1835 domain-containing protein n=1 Tax=Halalkalibacter alkalisediminis TaxID=935616 RepID=A0ABV6NP82_9BACI|nr:DUF1835 domain-containing protein [Halalkalibacter alkalisediminis]
MIHLIFGAAATASLKHALRRKNHQVIGFPIDFSIGPITNIHKENGIHDYFSWLNSSFHTMWRYLEGDQTTYHHSLQKLLEIEDGEQVTIWTCENTTEQIGLRISCYLLIGKEVDLSYVNTFHAINYYTKHMDVKIDIRQTADCNAEQLTHFYEHSTYPISEKMKNDYVRDGEKLLNSKSIVRTWRNGEIVDDVETRDDSFILDCADRIHNERGNQGFINATRVIGEVLGHSEQLLTDIWIEYRVRSLIHSNQLAYEGNLRAMRKYKIKVLH